MSNASSELINELNLAAKQRMKLWLLSPELQEHMERSKDVKRPARTRPYISISRQAGAGGVQIARLVGEQLGWDVLDKELLDFMTQRYGMPRDMLEVVDETRANWFHDVLGSFVDSRIVGHDSFVVHLERIVYLAALHGNVVIVGRGAQFMLPRISGLAVRIIASKGKRTEALMARHDYSREKAQSEIDRLDAERREFCRRHFHHDIENSMEYDLVINSDRLDDEAVAELTVDAFCRAHHAFKDYKVPRK